MSGPLQKWQDRVILAAEHAPELEQRSAELEFKERLSRDKAESQAYREYRKKHHTAAAAHHLRGMKAANGSGDMDEARKHGAMYELHMKKLGLDPWKEPPRELKAAMDADDRQAAHKFKAHHGDVFVVEEHKAKQAATNSVPDSTRKSLTELYVKAKTIEILSKAFPTDPSQPVGHDLEPELESKYLTSAKPSGALNAEHHKQLMQVKVSNLAGHGEPGDPERAREHVAIAHANAPRPVKQMTRPNSDKQYAAARTNPNLPSETHVLLDRLLATGQKATHPPEFQVRPVWKAPPAPGTFAANSASLIDQKISGVPEEPLPGGTNLNHMPASKVWGRAGSPQRARAERYDASFWEAIGRSVGINKSELSKAFPTDPSQKVQAPPELAHKYKAAAQTAETRPIHAAHAINAITNTAIAHGIRDNRYDAQLDAYHNRVNHGPLSEMPANQPRPGRPMGRDRSDATIAEVRNNPNTPSETHVLLDHLLASGQKAQQPPKFEAPKGPNSLATMGYDRLSQVTDMHVANSNVSDEHPDLGFPRYSIRQPAMYVRSAWKAPTHIQASKSLDNQFWTAVGRAAGINKTESMSKAVPPYVAPSVAETNERMKLLASVKPQGGNAALAPTALAATVKPAMPAPAAKPSLWSHIQSAFSGPPKVAPSAPVGMHPPAVRPYVAMNGAETKERMALLAATPKRAPLADRGTAPQGPKTSPMTPSEGNPTKPATPHSMGKSEGIDLTQPVFTPGQIVSRGERNHVVVKVHPGRGLGDPHLYVLRDPVDNSTSHAFEAELGPTKEQSHG